MIRLFGKVFGPRLAHEEAAPDPRHVRGHEFVRLVLHGGLDKLDILAGHQVVVTRGIQRRVVNKNVVFAVFDETIARFCVKPFDATDRTTHLRILE